MQHSVMDLRLRAYCANDFEFARGLYFETMRWAIERVFGWDQARQEASFAEWFKADEVSIIVADSADVGWIQQWPDGETTIIGSIYIAPAMQRKGIGTRVIGATLDAAGRRHQFVTLAVMKINPALGLYERLGFRITHEDEHKLYLRADASPG